MPEGSPHLVTIKRWILEAAADAQVVMSVQRAKRMAGNYLDSRNPSAYNRLTYSDPVGEGLARRWAEFKHNMAASAA